MCTEIKKALRKHSHKDKKCHAIDADKDSNSDNGTWRGESDSIGESNMCKKRKLNSLLEKYSYPSPNKAISTLKSDSSNKTKTNIAIKIAVLVIKQRSILLIKIE